MQNAHETPALAELVRRAIGRYDHQVALVDKVESLTYRQLGGRITQTMQLLEEIGIHAGDRVALLSGNTCGLVATALATYSLGLTEVPLHPESGRDDHAYMLKDSETRVLFYQRDRFESQAAWLMKNVACLEQLVALEDLRTLPAAEVATEATFTPRSVDMGSAARLAYTGGTTGLPKGVLMTQQGLVEQVRMNVAELCWPSPARFLSTTPMTHASGYYVVPTLLQGGTYFMADRFSPEGFLEEVDRHKITATVMVPTMIYRFLDSADRPELDRSSLRAIFYGAASTSVPRLQEAIDRFGNIFQQAYGLTEAPVTVLTLRPDEHRGNLLASCGQPFTGTQVTVLKTDGLQASPGEVGELCVRGPIVMSGYHGMAEETEAALAGGWLHTGDLAYEDVDGYFYIVGRAKDVIITGGFNVYPAEVEQVIAGIEGVAEVAVLGMPDQEWGEAVTAVVVRAHGAKTSAETLASVVRTRKGPVHVPKRIVFVEEIPTTALGKPDKVALSTLLSPGS